MRRRRGQLNTTINVTPFVDVMLVLLIVFMVCAPMMHSGVELSLPQTSAKASPTPPNNVAISINKKGHLFLDKNRVNKKSLISKLTQLYKHNSSINCLVCADASLNYQQILELLTLINQTGITRVSLISEHKN